MNKEGLATYHNSMPIGNGNVAANVNYDAAIDTVALLLSTASGWSEDGESMKAGSSPSSCRQEEQQRRRRRRRRRPSTPRALRRHSTPRTPRCACRSYRRPAAPRLSSASSCTQTPLRIALWCLSRPAWRASRPPSPPCGQPPSRASWARTATPTPPPRTSWRPAGTCSTTRTRCRVATLTWPGLSDG